MTTDATRIARLAAGLIPQETKDAWLPLLRSPETPQCKSSYDDMKAMLEPGGVLSFAVLNKVDIPKEVRKTKRQREIDALGGNDASS